MKDLSLLKNRKLRFTENISYVNAFNDFLKAAKHIDRFKSEFSCMVLNYDLREKYDEIFKPNPNYNRWVFNDESYVGATDIETLNADELLAKEYRVIALLLANEMQKTGDL